MNPDLEVTPYHLIKRVVETEASHPIQVGPQAHKEKIISAFIKLPLEVILYKEIKKAKIFQNSRKTSKYISKEQFTSQTPSQDL